MSAEACKSCQGYIGQLDALYAEGGHLKTSGWEVVDVGSPPGEVGSSVEIPMRVNRTSQKVVSGNGNVERFDGGGVRTFSADVRWTNEQWVMQTLDVL
jgi:hypothetical protein